MVLGDRSELVRNRDTTMEVDETMGMHNTSEWRQGGRHNQESRFEGRRGIIARAARTCFERKGVAKTSIADIAREVNITRELFYYYFASKTVVVDVVIDTYVDDARELLDELMDASYETLHDALAATVGCLRAWMQTDDDNPVPMVEVLRETATWQSVVYRVASEAVAVLEQTGLLSPIRSLMEADVCGRKIALVGAVDAMVARDDLTDDQIASGVEPLFV